MRIWIFNNYNMLPEHGHLNRSFNFGKYLKRKGHEPIVFVGSHPHNTDLQLIEGKEKFKVYQDEPFPWVLIKTCNYEGSMLKRIYSMFEYYFNSKKAAKHFEKPDAILGSSAHPFAAVLAIKLAKKYKCKSIVEVRDLWPESLVAYEIVGKYNPITLALRRLEKWAYKKADSVVFTMEGAYEYITDRGWEKSIPRSKVFFINNGVDLEAFDQNKEQYRIEDPDLEDDSVFKVVYTGSIRKVNNVSMLLNAAKLIKNPRVKLLIWGNGDELPALKQRVIDEKIDNVVFKGKVEKWFVPYITSKCDLGIYHLDQSSIVKYGLSLNKMFDYFAAGLPVLTDCKTDYNPAIICNAGSTTNSNDPSLVAAEIERYASMSPEEMKNIKDAARAAAVKYDFSNLAEQLANLV